MMNNIQQKILGHTKWAAGGGPFGWPYCIGCRTFDGWAQLASFGCGTLAVLLLGCTGGHACEGSVRMRADVPRTPRRTHGLPFVGKGARRRVVGPTVGKVYWHHTTGKPSTGTK